MATYQKRGDVWRAIVRKKGMVQKSRSFPTKAVAKIWAERIEREYAGRQARGESEASAMTLAEVIDWYTKEVGELTRWGRSKTADLARLRTYEIASELASGLTMSDYVRHVTMRRKAGAGPATVNNDLIWLRQVLRSARASLGLPVNMDELDNAGHELRQRGVIAKPKVRTRRITPAEESALLRHFTDRDGDIPMDRVFLFALASARRQEEITRLKWADLRPETGTAWLDDVKHPRKKIGNRKEFRMLKEAWAVIETQRPVAADQPLVFPYNPKSIGAAFTRACRLLGLSDLRFHDLRHEATSRLFERGYSVHEVAQFTLHESWVTLKRYTHLNPADVPEREAK